VYKFTSSNKKRILAQLLVNKVGGLDV